VSQRLKIGRTLRLLRAVAVIAVALAVYVAASNFLVPPKPAVKLPQPDAEQSEPATDSAPGPTDASLASPFQNVQPGVAYVAESRCDECHAEIAARFRQHPMGRSMTVFDSATIDEERKIAPAPSQPLDLGGFQYEVDYSGDQVRHIEKYLDAEGQPAATIMKEIAYGVGAGSRGRSYLVRDGEHLLMSPITWYPAHQKWALSPGYERNNSHFYRPVVGACLFCHSGEANWIPETRNKYAEPILEQASIGCQRCHGPGELHVARHASSSPPLTPGEGRGEGIPSSENAEADFDPTIVNPMHLPDDLALDVCTQCHLSGVARIVAPGKQWNDFRPGLRLSDFLTVYVEKQSAGHHFVGHVEQMQESRCFQKSEGKLRCTSCHDPHGVPAADEQAEFYRLKCNACHGEGKTQCSEAAEVRQKQQDNCIACHLPALKTEITHAAVSDHRVLRRPENVSSEESAKPASRTRRLVPFDRSVLSRPGFPIQRNLGIALLIASENSATTDLTADTQAAVKLLEEAVEKDPQDLAAREGLGTAYERLKRNADALKQFEIVLAARPEREISVAATARLLMTQQRFAEAAGSWERAVKINATMPLYRAEWALALARQHQWADCERLCRDAVEEFPDSLACRQLLVESLLGLGRTADAETAFEQLVRLQPSSAASLRKWFADHPLRKSVPGGK
jgi:tetratricopeptide (TPR) repeat protein